MSTPAGSTPDAGGSAPAGPTGFHIMMPAGWQRYRVDDEGKRALTAQVSARMKALGRPDLDVEVRLLVAAQWRRLIETKVSAVYLPGPRDEGELTPASIAAIRHVAPKGKDFESSVRAMAGGPVERFETPAGLFLRWVAYGKGAGELESVKSRQIGYGMPLPAGRAGAGADAGPEGAERRGMIFLASIPYLPDTDPVMLEALTEMTDTIMETFRWR